VSDSPSLLPLTAAQRGIWNAQKLDPTSPYYVVGEVLELESGGHTGRIDTALLADAVRRTVDESETLRLHFTDTQDEPLQYVDHTPAVPPEIRDISGAPDPRLLAAAIIDAEKAECGRRWCTMTDQDLHRFLVLDLGDAVWCIQLYHHIIVDGYSAALLTRRTAAHYTHLAGGRTPRPAKFSPVSEIVDADRDYRASDAYTDDLDFWRDQLTPAPDTTGREDLVHGAGTTSITTTLRLDHDELTTLRERAENQGLVWSDLVLGAYGAWLRKLGLTRNDEALMAMPMMARTSGPLRRTPAMLVNMLPLRFPVDASATVVQVAEAAHGAVTEIRTHQRLPGSDLVRDMGSPAVLHGIGVNLKTFDFSLDFHGIPGVLRNIAGGPPEDLVLVVTPTAEDGLDLAFETDPASIDATTARQRLEDIRALMFAEGALQDIRLRDTATLEHWARSRSGEALPSRVPSLNERIAALGGPDATGARTPQGGLVDADTSLTAAEVHSRVSALADDIERSCPPGAVIALDLPKGVDLAVAVLAAWHAHRGFVVLDREHPEARRQHILHDSGAGAVLDGNGITPTDGTDSTIDEDTGNDLAYLLYTSGTTGTPKGVEVTRRGVEALLAGHDTDLYPSAGMHAQKEPQDVPLHVAHTASFSFDAAVDQLSWIFTGAVVHLYPPHIVGDPERIRTALVTDRIDVLDATPSLAGALIDSGALDDTDVSTLILGGEALPQSLWDRLAGGSVNAWNLYGPTETTVDALAARITPGPVTIGSPVPGMTAEILDTDGEVVPDNEVGELVLSGPQVARGYRGLVEQTAASFEDVPGAPNPHRYRTGDLVRWVPGSSGGSHHFLGRADDQVEIRGHRVEPGEVEAALMALPEITGAAVGTFGPSGARKLIAYVTLTAPAAAREPALDVRGELAAHVPGHLVPTRVRVLERLPLTVGGKVDRHALESEESRSPEAASSVDSAHSAAPTATSPTESALTEIVAAVLAVETTEVHLDQDFISLGGDSIGALTVAGRLRQRGFAIQAGDLLSGTDLKDIAAGAGRVGPDARGDSPQSPGGGGSVGSSAVSTVSSASTVSVTDRGTDVSTGAHPLPGTDAGHRPVLLGTVCIDTDNGIRISPDALTGAVAALLDSHRELRAVLDTTDPDGSRLIVPREPLVTPSSYLVGDGGTPVTTDEIIAHLDPTAGLTWSIGRVQKSGQQDAQVSVQVAVDPLLLNPTATVEILNELATTLGGSVETDSGLTPVPLHDTEAALNVLPDLFNVTVEDTATAAALLAVDGPVAVWRDSTIHGGDIVTVPPLPDDITMSGTNPDEKTRAALLHAKEHLRADATDADAPAPATPLLTVVCAGGSTGLTATSISPVLFMDPTTGDAHLCAASTDTTDALSGTFTDLAVLARTSDGGATPSDFTHLDNAGVTDLTVTQATIDTWESVHGPLADVLPVSPLQEGLLYHAATGGDGYVLAAGIDLCGGDNDSDSDCVDPERLRKAFLSVLERHDLLRARFDTDTLDSPVQLIPRHVELPWRISDLTALPTDAATEAADRRLRVMASRRIGSDELTHGPLVAAELVLLPNRTARLILGNHHLLTDGWSTPVMLRDLLYIYNGEPLGTAAPYSDYLDWLARRDVRLDEDAWRSRLDGLDSGTLVREIAPATTGTDREVTGETLQEVTTDTSALLERATEAGVTPNTLLQSAWAISLASLFGRTDVVFGTTVSGRPTELSGIENTVGLFINTVPARVTLDSSSSLASLLTSVGRTQAGMTAHDATPLVRIEQLAGCGPLFDSLVVHDNFPGLGGADGPGNGENSEDTADGKLRVEQIHTDGMTDFPISVVAPPGPAFRIVLAHRADLVDAGFVDLAHRTLRQVLEALVTDPDTTVGALLASLPEPWEGNGRSPVETELAGATVSASGDTADTTDSAAASTIAEVMAALLGQESVSVHDNFFDIGGHSLLAMRLLGRLRRAGLDTVTIQDIVETGSPAALAARLHGGGSQDVLPLRPGTDNPLFCIHPGGGLVLPFRGLAEALDEAGGLPDLPLTGLQLPSPHPDVSDLGELAVRYADTVQEVRPQGPYRLLGYSFGGTLAHAMAVELTRRGEKVSYLGIMDAYPAGRGPALPSATIPDTPDTTALAAVAGLPSDAADSEIPGVAELTDNLRFCDGLLRTADPADSAGSSITVDGPVQLMVATTATDGADHAGPDTWDPTPEWERILERRPDCLALETTHEGLVTADGWHAIAPFIASALTSDNSTTNSLETL
jgi:amino acid adenylation domain-containing protein